MRPERQTGKTALLALEIETRQEPHLSDFPVRYDPTANAITMEGPGGASIMLTTLLKAKFGDALDPLMLFHEPLAKIMFALAENCIRPSRMILPSPDRPPASGPFTAKMLNDIGEAILNESVHSGWWARSRQQQTDYLRDVVAAPHSMSDEQIEVVFDAIEAGLFHRRRVLDAAAGAKV